MQNAIHLTKLLWIYNKFANLEQKVFQKNWVLTKWILIALPYPDVIILGMPVNLISSAHSSKTPWAGRGSVLPPERKHKELCKQEICGPSEYEDTPETWLQRIYLPSNNRFLFTIKIQQHEQNFTWPAGSIRASHHLCQECQNTLFGSCWKNDAKGNKTQVTGKAFSPLTDTLQKLFLKGTVSVETLHLVISLSQTSYRDGVNKHQMGKIILGHSKDE